MTRLFAVFDVESVGLHGEGFAVGGIVVSEHGQELSRIAAACKPENAIGSLVGSSIYEPEDRKWLADNLPTLVYTLHSPRQVRRVFWDWWMEWKAKGALLAADVPWPVEARFLNQCIGDDPEHRKWEGPYPLIDIASVRLAAGFDPIATEERLPSEEPKHDPLADARQSARLLLEALDLIREPVTA